MKHWHKRQMRPHGLYRGKVFYGENAVFTWNDTTYRGITTIAFDASKMPPISETNGLVKIKTDDVIKMTITYDDWLPDEPDEPGSVGE